MAEESIGRKLFMSFSKITLFRENEAPQITFQAIIS